MTKTTKSKMLSFLLCFVMIATTFCQTAMTAQAAGTKDVTVTDAQGTAVQDITLPKNGPKDQKTKLTARAGVSADAKYQWQILADADSELWVDIRGEKAAEISVSYPMVRNLIDKDTGSTSLRCKIKDGSKTLTSDAVRVKAGEKVRAEAAAHPTKAEIRKAAAKTATDPTPQADDEITAANDGEENSTYSIIINYVFANGGQAANPWTATVAKGSDYNQTVTSPTVVGYAPDQATVDVDVKDIQSDKTYTVKYQPAEVEFTVKHYQQNVSNDEYILADTETKTGYTESKVGDKLKKSYDGFTGLLYDTTTKIASDGSTVVEIYYDRNYYLMNFDLDGGYGVEPIYARYGAKIEVGKPTKAGYEFVGWTKDNQSATISDTMSAENTTYKASWEKGDNVKFTVVFWYENADDDGYSYVGNVEGNAKVGTSVSSNDYRNESFDGRDNTHFTYNANKAETVTVKGDGSTVLNVYYTRNTYTLTFKNGNIKLTCTKTEHTHTSNTCCDKSHWRSCNGYNSWTGRCNSNNCPVGYEHTHNDNCYEISDLTITAKYQQDIHSNFPIKDIKGDSYNWHVSGNTYQVAFDIMPDNSRSYTAKETIADDYNCYYYLEIVNGTTPTAETKTLDGKTFALYKKIPVPSGVSLTYNEEFHNIAGFKQYKSNPNVTPSNSPQVEKYNYFYYTRNSYNLKFYNHDAFVTNKAASVQYEAPLKGYDFTPDYPSNLEPGAYEFAGWYTSPGCYDGSEVDWYKMTMPAADVTLYAKWAPKTHKVTTWLTDKMDTAVNVGDTGSNEQTVLHGSKATAPDEPKNGNYTFVGWFYKENGVEKAFDFSIPVNRDLDLYAKWSSNVLVKYTIKYELEGGTEIAPPSTGSALAGTTKTFDAKTGTELNEGYQTGYFPESSSHSITMDINGNNEYTFFYVKKAEVNYTVRYLEKGTGNVLYEDKTVSTSDAVITETFKPKTGYAPDAYQKRLVLSAKDEDNVITFWYTKDDVHAPVQIIHWTQNIAGDGYTEYQSSTDLNGVIGNDYSEEWLSIPGFTRNTDKSNTSGTLTAEGLVLNLYYDRIEYPYEFRFLEQDTDKKLADPVTGNARYQSQVTQTAKDIPGYTLVSAENQAINIAIEDPANVAKENVKTFYYTEQTVDIKYQVVGPNGCGTLDNYQDNGVKVKTGTVKGSAPTPAKGYKFVGWYKDEACTTAVDSDWIDANKKLTPQKEGTDPNKMYKAATYYAKFEKDIADLTIKKTGCSDADTNQSFIFDVKDKNGKLITTVTIHGNSSATIKDLQIGEYTVTEKTEWSWRYEPKANDKKITLNVDEVNEVTFQNDRKITNWLNGSSWCKNAFKDGKITQTRTTTNNSED